MNSHYELRHKYRSAMFNMQRVQHTMKEFLNELKDYYGCRLRSLPDKLRKHMDEFMKFLELSDKEKVLVPEIPDCPLGYKFIPSPTRDMDLIEKVKEMMALVQEEQREEQREYCLEVCGKREELHDAELAAAEEAFQMF